MSAEIRVICPSCGEREQAPHHAGLPLTEIIVCYGCGYEGTLGEFIEQADKHWPKEQ